MKIRLRTLICFAIGILSGYEIGNSFKCGRWVDGIIVAATVVLWLVVLFLRDTEE